MLVSAKVSLDMYCIFLIVKNICLSILDFILLKSTFIEVKNINF